jgi:hypothetical protein
MISSGSSVAEIRGGKGATLAGSGREAAASGRSLPSASKQMQKEIIVGSLGL